MAELPTRIQVGPLVYTLEQDERIVDAGKSWGQIDHRAQIISLRPGIQPGMAAVTMLHEVLHAIWMVGNLEDFGGDEEKLLGALDGLLLDTLRRNPDLSTFLLDKGE